MQVKEIMTKEVNFVAPTSSLTAAARHMRDRNIGSLPVGDNGRLIGMITDRDITIRAVADGKDPNATSVGDTMTHSVVYCFDDQSVEEVSQAMGQHAIRRLPVVDRDKRLVGIVSIGDLSSAKDNAATVALGEMTHKPPQH